jgi:Uri superfamily endonuclease
MEIGALGDIHFRKGLYFYVGSALRGIGKRVSRHLTRRKTCYWHIDYLLMLGNLCGVVYILTSEKDAECRVARALDRRFESILNFGCSDCRCESHLFYQGIERGNDGKTSSVGEKEEVR